MLIKHKYNNINNMFDVRIKQHRIIKIKYPIKLHN